MTTPKSKGTPGPWCYDRAIRNTLHPVHGHVQTVGPFEVAQLDGDQETVAEVYREADASLIAAAWELRERLRACVEGMAGEMVVTGACPACRFDAPDGSHDADCYYIPGRALLARLDEEG